jgi:hypothetical protein
MAWLLERLWRLRCVFRGHNSVLHFEREHLSLRCLSCGYRTPGWSLRPHVGHASSPVHDLSPQPMGNLARRRAIVDETGGSAFAEHVTRGCLRRAIRGETASRIRRRREAARDARGELITP